MKGRLPTMETPGSEWHWLAWARRLQAISQTGIAFSNDPYHLERFEAVRDLAAEIMATGTGVDFKHALDLFSGQSGYATPKVDTRGVVFRDGSILMVKEKSDQRWTLPGGWADVGESPSEAVIKEIREEAGLICKAVKLLAVLDGNKGSVDPRHPFHVYKLFILCEIVSGKAKPGIETDAVGFFEDAALPELSTARASAAQIHRMFEHVRNPAWPADFD